MTLHRLLHVMIGKPHRDVDSEAVLLQPLLGRGADVNAADPKSRTRLETAATRFAYSDQRFTPLHDALVAHPDCDPLLPGSGGRPVLLNLRKWTMKRAELVAGVEALLADRGISSDHLDAGDAA